MEQYLGLCASTAGAQVRSLIRELGSHIPLSVAKTFLKLIIILYDDSKTHHYQFILIFRASKKLAKCKVWWPEVFLSCASNIRVSCLSKRVKMDSNR